MFPESSDFLWPSKSADDAEEPSVVEDKVKLDDVWDAAYEEAEEAEM